MNTIARHEAPNDPTRGASIQSGPKAIEPMIGHAGQTIDLIADASRVEIKGVAHAML